MEKEGVHLLANYKDFSVMGFWEVISQLPRLNRLMRQCKHQLLSIRPDILVLIDYPGFNLRIAKFAKANGIKTVYYIPPKIWAWNSRRIRILKQNTELVLSILPFEKEYYASRQMSINYVGHPCLEQIANHQFQPIQKPSKYKYTVAILPGSRLQEVKKSLKVLGKVILKHPKSYFLIGAVDNLPFDVYLELEQYDNVKIIVNRTYDLLRDSNAAIVVSGTATVETAVIGIPQVVCYKTSGLTYLLARLFLSIKYISLVNLIADKPIVKELIQGQFNASLLSKELKCLLHDHSKINKIKKGYRDISLLLGDDSASINAADHIINAIN